MNTANALQAVVTGGTSGIGAATARLLAKQGYQVTATGVFEAEVAHSRNDPSMAGIAVEQLDVRDSAAVTAFFARFAALSALVNCAGIGRGAEEFNEAGFTLTIDINLHGTMRCCYAALPALAIAGGAVVNIASVMSIFGSATGPAYSASKGAVMQLTKSLALAWAERGIRVNAVAPGWIETPMTTLMQADIERNRKVLERSPMGRWGKPEEIAQGIGFLLSPQASFITGVLLPIDGGYTVKGI